MWVGGTILACWSLVVAILGGALSVVAFVVLLLPLALATVLAASFLIFDLTFVLELLDHRPCWEWGAGVLLGQASVVALLVTVADVSLGTGFFGVRLALFAAGPAVAAAVLGGLAAQKLRAAASSG